MRSHLSVWMQLRSILAMGGYSEGPQIRSKLSRDTAESFPTRPTAFFPTEPYSIHLKPILLDTFRQTTRGLPCALPSPHSQLAIELGRVQSLIMRLSEKLVGINWK